MFMVKVLIINNGYFKICDKNNNLLYKKELI